MIVPERVLLTISKSIEFWEFFFFRVDDDRTISVFENEEKKKSVFVFTD